MQYRSRIPDYNCEFCKREIDQGEIALELYLPFKHWGDNIANKAANYIFCSDYCIINFLLRGMQEHGPHQCLLTETQSTESTPTSTEKRESEANSDSSTQK